MQIFPSRQTASRETSAPESFRRFFLGPYPTRKYEIVCSGRFHAARVEIREGSVSQVSFSGDTFDLITAVETHFWWPDLPADLCELLRVLKPGSKLVIIAEIYAGAKTRTAKLAEKYLPMSGMKLLSVKQHRDFLENAGYSDVQIIEEPSKGWICCAGRKPLH